MDDAQVIWKVLLFYFILTSDGFCLLKPDKIN